MLNMARKLNKACSCSSLLEIQEFDPNHAAAQGITSHIYKFKLALGSWLSLQANFRNQVWFFSKQILSMTCQEVLPATL